MTPLAQMIVRDSLERPDRRRLQWRIANDDFRQGDFYQDLLRAHCFEFSAVWEAVGPLAIKMMSQDGGKTISALTETAFAFLPAPSTWIEYLIDGGRSGILLVEAETLAIGVVIVWHKSTNRLMAMQPFALPLRGHPELGALRFPAKEDWQTEEQVSSMHATVIDVYPMLAMINSPRVILRRQHMPHAGLQKTLAAARGMVGKFPLLAWTEIILEVRPPDIDLQDHEASLTGKKALHFCRKHLRIRLGKLELVSAHWRGDPALGIKRSRYVMA